MRKHIIVIIIINFRCVSSCRQIDRSFVRADTNRGTNMGCGRSLPRVTRHSQTFADADLFRRPSHSLSNQCKGLKSWTAKFRSPTSELSSGVDIEVGDEARGDCSAAKGGESSNICLVDPISPRESVVPFRFRGHRPLMTLVNMNGTSR